MTMIGIISAVILFSSVIFAIRFYHKQNEKTETGEWVGGAISWPKAYWLSFAIHFWFFQPLVFFLIPELPFSLKVVVGVHLASWWIRGPLELVMIYRWYNWTPVHGISHDAIHSLVLFCLSIWSAATIGIDMIWARPELFWVFFNMAAISFLLSCEVVFAALFIATRDHGAHKIYFADETERYRLINRLTLAGVIFGYTSWAILTGRFLLFSVF